MNDGSAEITSAINPSGETAPGESLGPASPATLEAGRAALETHVNESTPKSKRKGRPPIHGRYSNAGKSAVPVAQMDNGTDCLLLAEAQPESVSVGTEEIQPAFDEAINREYAALILQGLEFANRFVKRIAITRKTKNKHLAEFVVSKKVIPEDPRSAIETSLVKLAKKHNWNLSDSPEWILLTALLVWQGEDAAATNAAIAEWEKMRPEEKAA